MSHEKKYWYVARTRDKQELSIREKIQAFQLECFIPTRKETRQLKYRRKEVEVPIIRNMIFIHATKQQAIDLHNLHGLPIFYISDLCKRGMLIVPDKQMQDFMMIMDLDPEGVSFDNDSLTIGSKVSVIKGDFCGLEGEIASDAQRTYVVIRIHGLFTASVKLPKSYLKPLK